MQSKSRLAIIAVSIALGVSSFAFADAPTFSGYLETGYNYNFNNPNTQTNRVQAFTNKANTFDLNAFQLQATGKVGDSSGYTAKALFGSDAQVLNGANGNGTGNVAIEEAYAWYKAPLGSGLTITAGKFVTFEGIEVIEGNQDYTVSRGLLFSLAEPYTHTGVKADYAFTKQLDLAVGVVNGWNDDLDNNTGKTLIGRLGINLGDPFSGGISGTWGDEKASIANGGAVVVPTDKLTSLDATFSTVVNKKLTVAYQANYGEEANANAYVESHSGVTVPINTSYATWFGFGIQPKVTLTDKIWIGGRFEFLEDKDGLLTGTAVNNRPTDIKSLSIAPAYNLTSALVFQIEGRYDWANQEYFDQRVLGATTAQAAAPNYVAANQFTVAAKFDYTF